MLVPDKKTDLLIKMLAAIEGSRGTLDWEDIGIGAMQVAARKKQEAVVALLGSLPLTDVMTIATIASEEALLARSKSRVEVISETQAPTQKGSEAAGPAKGPNASKAKQKRRPG